MELLPPLHLGVVTIEKGAFRLPLTKVTNLLFNLLIYTRCLNIHRTYVTANSSTNNNVVFFFVSDLKIVHTITTINPQSQCLGQERKIFCLTTYLETKLFKTDLK